MAIPALFCAHRRDLLLILCVLLLALLLWGVVECTKTEGAYVAVLADGTEIARYPLAVDTEVQIGDEAQHNLLRIRGGVAEVISATCPDHLCVRQHSIRYAGETIVCLPNKTVFLIVGGVKGPDLQS